MHRSEKHARDVSIIPDVPTSNDGITLMPSGTRETTYNGESHWKFLLRFTAYHGAPSSCVAPRLRVRSAFSALLARRCKTRRGSTYRTLSVSLPRPSLGLLTRCAPTFIRRPESLVTDTIGCTLRVTTCPSCSLDKHCRTRTCNRSKQRFAVAGAATRQRQLAGIFRTWRIPPITRT